MAKNHQNKKSNKAHKYTNPTTVPTKKKKKIFRDDPRNTDLYKQQSDETYDVVDEDSELLDIPELDVSDDFWDENNDPGSYYIDEPDLSIPTPIETMEDQYSDYSLSTPQNLYVDPTSYQIENGSANSDGSVRWVAYLYFDDVVGADSYEYVINASGS